MLSLQNQVAIKLALIISNEICNSSQILVSVNDEYQLTLNKAVVTKTHNCYEGLCNYLNKIETVNIVTEPIYNGVQIKKSISSINVILDYNNNFLAKYFNPVDDTNVFIECHTDGLFIFVLFTIPMGG